MKEVAILLLLALLLNGCGTNQTNTQQAAGGVWESQMLGWDGSASGFSFSTQFVVEGNGALDFSSFQFLTSGGCFPVNGGTVGGAMDLTVNQTNYEVTGSFNLTVTANGNTLTLTSDDVTGTENGLNGTQLTGGSVTGTWTLSGSCVTNGTAPSGSFVMNQSTTTTYGQNQSLRYATHHAMYSAGTVAATPHQRGNRRSAPRPSTVKTIQKIFLSIELF